MNATLRNSLALLALAAATPAGAWSAYPDVDFEWYTNAGRPQPVYLEAYPQGYPAPRAGFIWAPARYEWRGGDRQVFVPGSWIVDDYDAQWRYYASGNMLVIANGPLELRDRDGNVIPTNPDAYPVVSARR